MPAEGRPWPSDDDDDDDHDVANLEAKWAKPVHGRSDYQSP